MNIEYDYKGLANEVISRGISLAENFDDWTKLAFSLSNLGKDGREIFKSLSSMSDSYKENENDRKFTNALHTSSKVDISSFVWLCKQKGIDVKKYVIKDGNANTVKIQPIKQHKDEPQRLQIDYIPAEYLKRCASYDSDFVLFLCGLFGAQQLKGVMSDYALGATKNKGVIFWQIDINGKIRTGKVMQYDSETGHRLHNGGANWVHSLLMRQQRKQPTDFHLQQCLFGEHLLKMYPNKNVAIVEAEKTAVICSALYNNYVWLAAGGKGNLQPEKLKALAGRNVTLFPDTDTTGETFTEWSGKADELRAICNSVYVSDILERNATSDDKANKIDIADWLIRELEAHPMRDVVKVLSDSEKLLMRMEEHNPAIKTLVEKLNLEVVA